MARKLPFEFLSSPEFAADPHSAYRRLREAGPVHAVDFPQTADAFLIVDYEHARAALNDPRLSKSLHNASARFRETEARGNPMLTDNMLMSDPPDHTRMRRVVANAFTPRRVERLGPRVREIADGLIDAIEPKGEADLIEEFALPLPITVICELLGVPVSDQDIFHAWSRNLVTPAFTEEQVAVRAATAEATRDYFTHLIAARRAGPRDDLVSALVSAHDENCLLSDRELLSMLVLLLVAGHETTVNLIGNGMAALLADPAQLRLLRGRPELLPSAVEEFLRYDSPVKRGTMRVATEDIEVAGTKIPKGAHVHISIGAACRDPAVFPDPDRLDVIRTDNRHIAFGYGIHFCLGAPLARLEGQIAFGSLLGRLPGLAPVLAPHELSRRLGGSLLRGLTALPVRF
jgi:cytochrome P450